MRSSQSNPSHLTSRMIESTYSWLSPVGSVSSIRKLQVPPYWAAIPKLRQTDLACPIWGYPFGSGGNRVASRPWNRLVLKCSSMISLIKSDGGDVLVWAIESVPFSCSASPLNISYPSHLARPGFKSILTILFRFHRMLLLYSVSLGGEP